MPERENSTPEIPEIFVPFWGDPDLLIATLQSIRAQTVPHWRATVLDDRYPVDAAEPSIQQRVEALGDERIRYILNDENLGVTGNFRRSVQLATSDYVTIIGCDDLMLPNYLQVVADALTRYPQADVIQPGVQVIDEHGEPAEPLADRVKRGLLAPKVETELSGEDLATSLIRGNWLYWPSLCFRTQTLREHDFRDGFAVIQDLALLMDIAFAGGTLVFTPERAFEYRRHLASASMKTLFDGERFADERRYYALAADLARKNGFLRTAAAAQNRFISRLHGASELPRVALKGNAAGVRSALAHIFLFDR